jgi:hypothetical protein
MSSDASFWKQRTPQHAHFGTNGAALVASLRQASLRQSGPHPDAHLGLCLLSTHADIAFVHRRLADPLFVDQMTSMDLDDQIRRYFGTSDLASVPPEALNAGIEHMLVDLGLTRDRGERFALWALLHTLGSAPDLDVTFETDVDREAARNFMDLIQGTSGA